MHLSVYWQWDYMIFSISKLPWCFTGLTLPWVRQSKFVANKDIGKAAVVVVSLAFPSFVIIVSFGCLYPFIIEENIFGSWSENSFIPKVLIEGYIKTLRFQFYCQQLKLITESVRNIAIFISCIVEFYFLDILDEILLVYWFCESIYVKFSIHCLHTKERL